ncbi:NUDIX domain protein [Apiospora hydei]|uniref:NUDIX domain protein n=1 Tax=Apiospora hydei TaxID=1337664 RepID=A0ABR1WZ07_9PEZI
MADQGATVPTSTATDDHFPAEQEKNNAKEGNINTGEDKNTTALATALTVHPSLTPYHQTTPAADTPTTALKPRVLLLQRALTDTYPGIWELPGGSCDDTADPTPARRPDARAARGDGPRRARGARGLVHIQRVGRNGRLTIVTFLMDVEPPRPHQQQQHQQEEGNANPRPQPLSSWNSLVKLDPAEHRDFVWATEHEVRQDLAHGGRRLEWRPKGKEVVLKGFRMAAEAAEQ